MKTAGIHHITSIVGDPQENAEFYAGVLGLRLVKKTVNFDDPETYHLYFGNEKGEPGTIITFFPWGHAPQGQIGAGQVGTTVYVVPEGSLDFWKERLASFDIAFDEEIRFGETFIQFEDIHGLQLELVARAGGLLNTWEFNGVTSDVAIKGFGGAVLLSGSSHYTSSLLENVLGLKMIGKDGDYRRFQSFGEIGNIIDVYLPTIQNGVMGVGTVHHIAWRAKDDQEHMEWRNDLHDKKIPSTDIVDRQYFNALYFREVGGILFEIATDPPGFTTDEKQNELGTKIMLPSWLEENRGQLEQSLASIEIKEWGK
jgi:glyoxalase family protein